MWVLIQVNLSETIMKILTSLFIIIIFTHSSADASVISKKLQTINKNSFEIEHSTFDKNKPIILFLAGLGNKGNQINQIRDEFSDAKLNLFTFSRHENPCDSFRTCISNVSRRVKTRQIIISNKGATSSLEDIFENEITATINYIIQNHEYNKTKGIFLIGQFFSIEISSIFTLLSPKGTLSRAPGASNLLYKDLATSSSGEIITSIGILDILYSLPHLPSKKSLVRILAIFFETLNNELAN